MNIQHAWHHCYSPIWSSWLHAVAEDTQSDGDVDESIVPDIARQENNALTRKHFNLRFAKPEDICKEVKSTPC